MLRIDPVDRRLLGLLQSNARASYASMGSIVGLSAPATKRRVDRLRASGAIKTFTITMAPEILGWTTEAYVELFCRNETTPKDITAIVQRHPEVLSVCTVTGEADALMHVVTRDVRHLDRVLALFNAEPAVLRTRSAIVLSRLLSRAEGPPTP